jgi:predicted ATPase
VITTDVADFRTFSIGTKRFQQYEFIEVAVQDAHGDQVWFPAWAMSDGTIRALVYLVGLLSPRTFGSPRAYLIEEPEAGLHPGAAAVLRDAFSEASFDKQIIVATHSDDLLDDYELPSESILAVMSSGGISSVGPLNEGIRAILRDKLETVGSLMRTTQVEPEPPPTRSDDELEAILFGDSLG